MNTHKATFYAQVEANRRYGVRNPETSLRRVNSIKVAKITQSYPQTRMADTVVVKLTIEVPDAAFDPLLPNAVIAIPESMVQHPILIEAEDPNGAVA